MAKNSFRNRNRLAWYHTSFVALAVCCAIGSAFGQMTTGIILGTVTDSSAAVVPGAQATITNLGTGISTSFVTGSDGSYVVPYLIPGTYSVSVVKPGFKTVTKTGITLQVDQKARVDLTLQLGSPTQLVTVKSDSPLLSTQSSELGQVITSKTIVDLPLNLRQFAELVNLNTGAVSDGGLGATFSPDNPQALDSSSINGVQPNANNWTIDGTSDNEVFFGVLSVSPSIDAIQEFKVTNDNYSAEYGRAGGANVQVSIKSGTNQFHGDAFEFFRNQDLDANDFFSNQSGSPKPPYRQNQFGANLGGPIIKNRTFFFVDYEGLRTGLGQTGLLTIPTTAQGQGDFSAPGNPIIYNPFDINPTTGQPEPFKGNVIPTQMINSASSKIVALLPPPNLNVPLGQPNYFGSSTFTHATDEGDVRVDHRIADRDQLMVRYSQLRSTMLNPAFLGTAVGGLPGFTASSYTRNQNVVISETHNFNPSTLNEFRVGLNRVNTNWVGLDLNTPTSAQVGIPGVNNFCGVCGGLVELAISGFSRLGHTPYAPTLRHDTTFEYVDNLTHIQGKHTLKVGADIQRLQADLFQTHLPIGEFSFNPDNTSLNGASGTGSGVAGFLLGYPSSGERDVMGIFPSNRATQAFFFGQDDYRVTQNLTLNLGMRWEYYSPVTDAWNNMYNFNLLNGNMQRGCVAISCSGGIEADLDKWAPRFGFAYSLGRDGKTVIRGGYGISYFYSGGNSNFGTGNTNYPDIISQILSPANLFAVTPGDPVLTNGYTAPPSPQVRPGAPPGNIIPQGSVYYLPPDLPMPQIQQWTLDVQRQLTADLMVSVAYSANRGNYLDADIPFNYPEPGQDLTNPVTGMPNTLQQRRPYYSLDPLMVEDTDIINGGTSSYNALQIKAEKRFSHGLSFLAAYTWSHDVGRGQNWVNPDFYRAQLSNVSGQPRQIFVLSYNYQLPFGRSRQFGSSWNKWTDGALGGWQLSGILTHMTGLPFNPTVNSTLDNGNGDMPFRICDGAVSQPTIQLWYNINCFTTPGQNQFGNSGYNILYGPGFTDWDMAVMKKFSISESKYFQFRAEFYNTLNQVNFGLPSSLECGGLCGEGVISSLASNYTPRLIQFGLKFYY